MAIEMPKACEIEGGRIRVAWCSSNPIARWVELDHFVDLDEARRLRDWLTESAIPWLEEQENDQ